jgi:RNA polymerase sigma-70 factor (ECF subfamily)
VNSALQRARRQIAAHRPAVTQQATLRTLGDDTIKELADRYAAAWHASDVDAIVAMLAEDATFSMPPLPQWFRGHRDIRAFLLRGPMPYRWRFVPCGANAQPAFATYMFDAEQDAFVFAAVDVLTIDDGRIGAVVAFLSWDLWEAFGLPRTIAR